MENKVSNTSLHGAKKAKKDEFYTQLVDIEKELKHYKTQFQGKVVYCNCDDPFESHFFKFFAANFNTLELKKLITTSYVPSPIAGTLFPLSEAAGLKGHKTKQPFKIEINEVKDENSDGAINLTDVQILLKHDKNVMTLLEGDGDFRSAESIALLKQSYNKDDHIAVGEVVRNIKGVKWIVSYDDHIEIRKIYEGFRSKRHQLLHTARGPRIGKEILFFSRGLSVPRNIAAKY